MGKIETEADVREWAKAVVEAKGEKFTALSKGEQFVIAKYVVDYSMAIPDMAPDTAPDTEPQEEPQTPQAEPYMPEEGPHGDPETEPLHPTPAAPVADSTTATMTRGYAYHRAGCDAQQAFDKFLEWVKNHPKGGSVMDFSTGTKSVDAAFAYWLNEIITLEIPRGI